MKLLRLKLENFRQHKDSTIEFRDGMTAIVGPNGTGKTTLLEAITFALYGKQRETLDSVRFYWADGKRYSVTLRFELGGSVYEAFRSHSDAYLHTLSGGKEIVRATGKRAVDRAIERLIGLSYEQFKNSFCAEQKELAFLQFDNSTARQDEVARMLGFDRLRDAELLARERKKDAAVKILGMRAVLEAREHLERLLDEARRAAKESDELIQRFQKERASLATRVPEARIARERAETYVRLSADMNEIGGRAEGLKKAVTQAENAFQLAQKDSLERESLATGEVQFLETDKQFAESQKLKEANREREKFEHQRDQLVKDANRLEQELRSHKTPDLGKVQAALAEAASKERVAAEALKKAEKSWQEAQLDAAANASRCAARFEQLASALDKARQMLAKGICPECGQPISDSMKRNAAEREAELEEARIARVKADEAVLCVQTIPAAVTEAQAALKQCEEALENSQKRAQEAINLQAATDRIQREINLRRDQVAEVEGGLKLLPSTFDPDRHCTLAKRLEEMKPSHDRFLALADADHRLQAARSLKESAQRELDDQKIRFNDHKTQRASTGIESEVKAREIIASFGKLEADLRVAEVNLANAREGKVKAERELKRAQERAEQRIKQEAELADLDRKEILHDLTAREMKTLRELLNSSIRPDLIARASENLSLLTNGRYPVLDLDKNFKPRLIDDDVEKTVISGGEEDVVALSLRLALSELIQEMSGHPMSLLVLDEVFGSLDAERRQNVLERLLALKSRFRQIFIISHIEEINQVADQCIYLSRDPATKATVVADAMPEQIPLEI